MRPANELVAIARVFQRPADSLREAISPALLPATGSAATGSGARFAVVALPSGSYELRAIHPGATDLEWVQVVGGIREGERVVLLGDAARARPATPPPLRLADGVARTSSRATSQAGSTR